VTARAQETTTSVERGAIAGSAVVLSAGNVTSRVLGLLRETVITALFGATGAVSAFRVSSNAYNLLYELLVGGVISSAFVPVLSEYAERDQGEFRRLLGALMFLLMAFVTAIVVLLEFAAPLVTRVMGAGFSPQLQALTTSLLRLVLPAVLLLGLSGLSAAALYARQQFAYPAFMASLFNAALIACAFILSKRFDIRALALGVLAGSLCQAGLQAFGLWRTRSWPSFAPYHPAVKRVLLLALPVLGSLAIGQAQVIIDRNLASRTGEQSIAWMANATTLIQFPLGLVASAVSLATLPRLARLASNERQGQSPFLGTMAFSLRLVIVLVLPATAALAVLGAPLVHLLFQHGNFHAADSAATNAALRLYLIGLPFAAVDQCLILAFYARRDTLRPALVGLVAVGIYLAVALSTMQRLGMTGLVLANSAQWLGHAVIMLFLTRALIGSLRPHRVARALLQALAACAICVPVMLLLLKLLPGHGAGGTLQALVGVAVPGTFGLAAYSLAMLAMRNEDFVLLIRLVINRAKAAFQRG
jgi:putative peptidoglycan lipid II flippase